MECEDIHCEIGEFQTVARVEGGVTTDGREILMELATVESGPIHLRLQVADLEKFVTFLLRMAAYGRAAKPAQDRTQYQPIPISGVSAGELADGMGCLGVTIGATELMFQLPATALADVAQTLLMVAASGPPQRLS